MAPPGRRLERVLLVEDNAALRAAIVRLAKSWGAEVLEAGSASEARRLLAPPPDLIITDILLPDEPAFGFLEEAARLSPAPIRVAISGRASPKEAFRLAQLGVRAYLAKPLSLDELTAAVVAACREAPDLDPLLTEFVGHVPMKEMQGKVRSVMVKQALALTHGSRSGAARLLDVSRQAVQQMLQAGLPETPSEESEVSPDAPPSSGPNGEAR